ncbi:multidrug ABC transporter ATP-binding protein [Burkholderia sp. WAC0059]|uniref:ABC transporter ATP-binding protein n=1 Tax=Burkholderia sp. WAC0059 TaxID=2066022 RepID=UPI000C7F0DEC|nr:ABC transporter ATP-binding protein [Burkholderia sp. WAC0059]PLZ02952.1 multidrug ABC transporter ATP-binding protein [Burkholderia sp. WAC0059]
MQAALKRRRPQGGTAPVTNAQVLRFIAGYWMRHRVAFAVACALTLVWTGLDLCLPVASSRLIATVAAHAHGSASAWRAWRLFVGLFAGYVVARNATYRLWARMSAYNMEAMNNEVFAKVQAAPSEWHNARLAGETIRRVVRAMWGYDAVTDAVTGWFVPAFVVLFGLCAMIFWREPLAGVLALAIVILFLAVNAVLTIRYVRPANLRSNARDAALSGMLADSITANATVKSFAAEAREATRVAGATAEWRAAVLTTWRRFINIGLLQNFFLLTLLAGLSGAMLRAWTHGRAGPGDVAFAITSFLLMSSYLKNVGDNIRMLQRGIDDTSDAVAIRDEEAEAIGEAPPSASGAGGAKPTRGEIAFEHVSFAYPGATAPVCRDLSLRIRAGETVAILGESGSGKSTLVKLLQRLYEPQQGHIVIDGVDAREISLHALRTSIALAPQQPDLFHRSVFENIAYGRPGATAAEVERAAYAACADAFIAALPHGYETQVGERGAKLSGGQRQRVALARALLSDAPIVVLDETTSALDVETERNVLERIEPLLEGRTCIVITHRESTARIADRVLRYENGRLHEIEADLRRIA